jgi:vitamin B12 transporter
MPGDLKTHNIPSLPHASGLLASEGGSMRTPLLRRLVVPRLTALVVVLLTATSLAGLLPRALSAAERVNGGSLTGTLRTSEGQPLPHVVLRLTGGDTIRTLISGPDGHLSTEGLAAGEYTLTLENPGLVLSSEAVVRIEAGSVTRLALTAGPRPVREQILVSATRGEAALSTLGASATVLDRRRLEERLAPTVLDLLQETPGVATARSGGLGLQASAFVRGGESRFARVMIDGVPLNEPGGAFNFGTLLPFELEQVEIVRGAASSLYGTDALAGVIQLDTRRAAPGEALGAHAELEGGSYDTQRLLAGSSGRRGRLDWNAGLTRYQTDNREPNSAFDETAGAATAGWRLGARTSLRLVLRGEDSHGGTPGATLFVRPDRDASLARTAWLGAATLRTSHGRLSHELRASYASSSMLSRNPEDSGPYVARQGELVGYAGSDWTNTEGFQNDTARLGLSYQAEAQVGRRQLVTFGAELERETGALGDRREALLEPERTNVGAYVQDRLVLGERLFVTLGGRLEHNASYGTAAVPRAALAWRLRPGAAATTLRASAGAGIKEPGFLESFGLSLFAQGNPELKPERSRTFDVGLEQRLFAGRLRGEATLFRHDYRDQIAYSVLSYDPYLGSYVNLARTRAQGLELELEAAPRPWLRCLASYTRLDGKILVSPADFDPLYAVGQPLLRRPRHQGALTLTGGTSRLNGGLTLAYVGKRADSDFLGLGLSENPSYARLDARVRVRLARGLAAFAVASNLLDRQYQEILGYRALGRAVRVGLRFDRRER